MKPRPRATVLLIVATLALVIGCGKSEPTESGAATAPTISRPDTPVPTTTEVVETAATTPEPPPEKTAPTGPISDMWYAYFRSGQRNGWSHVVWTRVEVDGKPAVHDHTDFRFASTRGMAGTEDVFVTETSSDLDRTEDGLLLSMTTRTVSGEKGSRGSSTSTSVQTWTGEGYRLVTTAGGQMKTYSVACKEPVPVDTESYMSRRILDGSVAVGQRYVYEQPNFLADRMDEVHLHVTGSDTLALETGPAQCWRIHETRPGTPVDGTMWVDFHGVLRKYETETTRIVATTRERARRMSAGGVSFSITVHSDPSMPRCTDLDRAVVEIELAERQGIKLPDIPETAFSREVSRQGNRIRVELTANDDPDATVAVPVADESLAKWLESTTLLCSDAPEVRSAVRTAVGDETDGRETARKILHFVFRSLVKKSGPVASPNAAEILRDGMGDCSEHAVLFVAMCRAAGLPARQVSGYAQVGDMWGAHAFTEIWLGKWIGADPTTNELGTRARYVAFGYPGDPDSFPGVVSGRVTGRMSIKTLEFEEAGETFVVAETRRTATDDPLSGLKLATPPEGWEAKIRRRGQAFISGPGVTCWVSVAAGMGDLPADLLVSYVMPSASESVFGGIPCARDRRSFRGKAQIILLVPHHRRTLNLQVTLDDDADEAAAMKILAEILSPTIHTSETGEK